MDRFRQVTPKILRGGVPSEEEIRVLKDAWGVNRIVSLDLDMGEQIDPVCKDLGIEHIMIPIENDGFIEDSIGFLSDNIGSILNDNPTTFIHFYHGKDRTGLAVALYRMKEQGWSLKDALDEALSLDFGTGLSDKHKKLYVGFLENANKKDNLEVKDIATKVRESFDSGPTISPTDTRHSFSPFLSPEADYHSTPISFMPGTPPDQSAADDKKRKRKQQLRMMLLEDMNDAMAQVGVYENCNPVLRGIGPTEPCGYLPGGGSYLL